MSFTEEHVAKIIDDFGDTIVSYNNEFKRFEYLEEEFTFSRVYYVFNAIIYADRPETKGWFEEISGPYGSNLHLQELDRLLQMVEMSKTVKANILDLDEHLKSSMTNHFVLMRMFDCFVFTNADEPLDPLVLKLATGLSLVELPFEAENVLALAKTCW